MSGAGRVLRALARTGIVVACAEVARAQLSTDWGVALYQNLGGPGRLGAALAAGDFDGDGFDDLAIGEPEHTEGGELGAGRVSVDRGSPTGLWPTATERWSQDTAGVPGAVGVNEHFGAALAAGDFDGDVFDDLAIGVPADLDAGADAVGAVVVLYGSADGLVTIGSQLWSQDSAGVQGVAEAGDRFGEALAAGDFDGDGTDDLAIGVPGENPSEFPLPPEGAVHVLYGSETGLSATGDGLWVGSDVGLGTQSALGSALAAGQLDEDALDDLVVTAPAAGFALGAAVVFHGSAGGLSSADVETENGDQGGEALGRSVAIGDLNADGHPDLALGAPGLDLGNLVDVGRVKIFFGGFAALIPWLSLDPSSAPVPGLAEEGDGFGRVLSIGDFDHNGYGDLAIGMPDEDWAATTDAGALVVVHFEAAGPRSVVNNQQIAFGDLHPDGSAFEDHFGAALATGDFDASGHSDLALGVPDRGGPLADDAGVVWVLRGVLFADGFESEDTSAWSSAVP